MSNKKKLEIIRHSLAHVMAASVLKLWPQTRFGVGPIIDNGFYYDIEIPGTSLKEQDLKKIAKTMKKMIQSKESFTHSEIAIDEAIAKFSKLNQPYKIELLNNLKTKGSTRLDDAEQKVMPQGESKISLYQTGEFLDLCKGPHVEDSGELKNIAFCLHKLAGAYWRGNEENQMLTRIYGLAFASQTELDEHLELLAEAEKRDHRKLGRELELFVFSDLIGPGLPIYTPKGTIIRNEIINFSRELQSAIGYEEVHSPQMNKAELFKTSGHYEKFKDDMILAKSHYTDEEYFLKPMNCPQHTQIYASQKRSYRNLPLRYADFANLFRDEKPGELAGLTRLRCFSQDDGHSFCREDQIEQEFKYVLNIVKQALDTYGLDYQIRLSLWDEDNQDKYLGDKKIWNKSQKLLEKLLIDNKVKYFVAEGEAAFYGPKMDIIATDALKREFQISTIQLDFNMPKRFELKYTDDKGKEQTPVMIHRAIVGSPERFMGILIEHYGGVFPVWLSPVQVSIISVGEDHQEYCEKLSQKLKDADIRVEVDSADATVGNKIRKAVKQKIPYILVIGDKEINSDDLMVRVRGRKNLLKISESKFITKIQTEITNRTK